MTAIHIFSLTKLFSYIYVIVNAMPILCTMVAFVRSTSTRCSILIIITRPHGTSKASPFPQKFQKDILTIASLPVLPT